MGPNQYMEKLAWMDIMKVSISRERGNGKIMGLTVSMSGLKTTLIMLLKRTDGKDLINREREFLSTFVG
jgi:hypothetical protein